jgi:predicted aspartyl protease
MVYYEEREHTLSQPMLCINVANPHSNIKENLEAIIDTGADISCLPEILISQLGLNYTTRKVRDMNNKIVRLRTAGVNLTVECDIEHPHNIDVVFLEGEEAIIGRDILNQYQLILNPPELVNGTLCSEAGFSCEGVCD